MNKYCLIIFLIFISTYQLSSAQETPPMSNIYKQKYSPKDTESLIKNLTTFKPPEEEKEVRKEEEIKKGVFELTPLDYIKLGETKSTEEIREHKEKIDRVVLKYLDNLTNVNDFYAILRSRELPYDVIEIEEGRNYGSLYDTIYINVNADDKSKINLGDKFIIFQPLGKLSMSHRLYKSAAIAKVADIVKKRYWSKDIIAIANIIESYEPVDIGFKARLYKRPEIKKIIDTKNYISNINGKIVKLTGEQRFAGAGYMCIVDLGSNNNVKLGDVLDIIRIKKGPGFKIPNKLGEAQIIHVGEDFSTAIILTSDLEITEGDLVTLSKVAVYQ
ncbi:MAG: hypothetical protein SVN78_06280 [Deferribacterota bacterium]|nr:hypothetical protein [Deferribacterota bacterium]